MSDLEKILTHLLKDEDLMFRWGVIWSGDVRSLDGHRVLARMKRKDLEQLILAIQEREKEAAKK